MSEPVPDRIEKQILLRAPRARIWRALTDFSEFGRWFGVTFDSPFVPGRTVRGVVVGTTVDPAVAAAQQPYYGEPFEITIEQMQPERLFSFRWHPSSEKGIDYTTEPTTLVEFTLEEAAGGVMLTVTESGFDRVPLERRAKAFTANDEGWRMQVGVIEKYLANAA
jgi:uncharacterized protein YndB with AHSA1/START domain